MPDGSAVGDAAGRGWVVAAPESSASGVATAAAAHIAAARRDERRELGLVARSHGHSRVVWFPLSPCYDA